jgi:hypothetical protein
MAQLIRNAMQTPDGTILRSLHRHDYVTHLDKVTGKHYMLDGGTDYVRRSANGDEVMLDLYDDEPHSVQREVIVWGSRGKDGRSPLTYKPVAEMETDHIKAVLEQCRPSPYIKQCMVNELAERGILYVQMSEVL